jgi:hypothetical protein
VSHPAQSVARLGQRLADKCFDGTVTRLVQSHRERGCRWSVDPLALFLISRIEIYLDRAEALKAVGLEG